MEEQEKEKAEKVSKLLESMAESGAKVFESFLQEHQDATMEEKHEQLVNTFKSTIMTALLIVPMAL